MSNYNGRMGKGTQRVLKAERRMEAELRNEKTKPERRSKKAKKAAE
jgi:hypothetical protein